MVKSFFIAFEPPNKTFQDKLVHTVETRSGKTRAVIHDSEDLKAIKAEIRDSMAIYVPDNKFKAPIRVILKWLYKTDRKDLIGKYKTSKPDVDNLSKAVLDIMTELDFWKDDKEVASLVVEKFYNDIPGLYVFVEELENRKHI